MKQLVKRNLGLAIAIITLFIGSSAFAQPPGGGGQRGGQGGGQQSPPPVPNSKQIQKMVADLSKELFLTDKQETEISTIYVDHFSEVSDKMESGRPERTEMEALETKFEKKVSAVLTEEQQKLYANYLKKNAKQQKGGQRPS
ncbi:MAG: hypothetical protein ACERKD_14315 [Prolixibacteraceae bacterium]